MKNANPVSRRFLALGLCLAVALLAACGQTEEPVVEPKPISTYFPVEVGGATVQLQFAINDSEMERGLMYRRDLKPNQGMLFVYPEPRQMSFWMRNTPTPLEIGFFTSDGVLREVYALVPFDETSVKSKRDDLQYAMEVCHGWFDFTGVKPGDKIDLKAVAAAVRERGHSLREFKGLR